MYAVKKRTLLQHEKNAILLEKIRNQAPSVAQFCIQHGINQMDLGRLINQQCSPFYGDGMWRDIVLQVAEALNVPPSELFNPELMDEAEQRSMASSDDLTEVLIDAALEKAQREAMALEYGASALDVHRWLNESETLSPLEREILRELYFYEMTMPEVAATTGQSSGRIRQAESAALRALRWPETPEIVETFLEVQ